MNIVAVIPARGGSKTIANKNTREFCGKPLIAWSIEAAKKSKNINRIIVSTDDEEIKEIALKYGAEVPFMRPRELAVDNIGIEPVLKHTYEWLKDNDHYKADALVLLLPTTPTRQAFHIDETIDIFQKTGADSVVAVNETPANHTPYWTLTRQTDGRVTLWGDIPLKKILDRRQDFPQNCYARNDLAYVLKSENLYDKERSGLYGDKVELYIIEDALKYEVDINTPQEWVEAEDKFKRIIEENK